MAYVFLSMTIRASGITFVNAFRHFATEINFAKEALRSYNGRMKKQGLVEYFEEVETIEEYNGYFCSIPEAISIVVLGSICGLRNISQIHQWVKSDDEMGRNNAARG